VLAAWANVVEGQANLRDAVEEAKELFAEVALADELPEFLTIVAHDRLP
jgi:hypothetical protein